MIRPRIFSVLLAATVAAGCGPGVGDGNPDDASPSQIAASKLPQLPFLGLIPNAPLAISYQGKRRVQTSWTVGGQARTLDYVEEVWSDGQGKFLIIPGAVAAPAMTVQEAEFFALLQQQRDGFFIRHRDFRIRNLGFCKLNYDVVDTGSQRVVANRTCVVLEVHRHSGGSSWYRAAVDPTTGLVMRFEELTGDGRVLSTVEFLEFALGAIPSGVRVHGDLYVPTPIDPNTDTTVQLGFQVKAPQVFPPGYRFVKADSVVEGGQTWARLFYGDGVEQVFFLQTAVPAGQGAAPVPAEHYVGPKVLRVLTMGPWTMLELTFNSQVLLAVGKVDESTLRQMLRSALR